VNVNIDEMDENESDQSANDAFVEQEEPDTNML
jgi:hypothetical protein